MNEVLRQEKKYRMTMVDANRLCGRLGNVMIEDTHNGAMGYPIRSLYFDTPDNDGYWDKVGGVERNEQVETLRALHCDVIQGFRFPHPIPAWEARRKITEQSMLGETVSV